MKPEISDALEELRWLQGYVETLEAGFGEVRNLMNESEGVTGYHLSGLVATWEELFDDSLFAMAEDNIAERKAFSEIDRPTTSGCKVLYIKNYPHMPCTVQYTPVYGGQKYVRSD